MKDRGDLLVTDYAWLNRKARGVVISDESFQDVAPVPESVINSPPNASIFINTPEEFLVWLGEQEKAGLKPEDDISDVVLSPLLNAAFEHFIKNGNRFTEQDYFDFFKSSRGDRRLLEAFARRNDNRTMRKRYESAVRRVKRAASKAAKAK